MVSPTNTVPKGGVVNVAYAAAKGGVNGFTRQLAFDLAPFNIRVNAIAAGRIIAGARNLERWSKFSDAEKKAFTDLVPLRREGHDSDILGAVLFFATDESAYVTGQIVDVDGGSF